jgi:hypothetical protein
MVGTRTAYTYSSTTKVTTLNSAFDALDTALSSVISEALSGSTFTMPTADYLGNGVFLFTGALTGDCTITLPGFATSEPDTAGARLFGIVNETTGGHSLIFTVGTGTANVTISDSDPHLMHSDGTANIRKLS